MSRPVLAESRILGFLAQEEAALADRDGGAGRVPRELPEGASMALFRQGRALFTSGRKWLHPLFEAEAFLGGRPDLAVEELLLVDRMIGRAAAFLVVALGIRSLHALVLSRGGREILEAHGVTFSFGELIERTCCATEDLLEGETEVARAVALLRERKRRADAKAEPGHGAALQR